MYSQNLITMKLDSKRPSIKHYGIVTATSIVVANMVGSGIFVTSGLMAANLPGPGWVIFCWIFGGLIALSGAFCFTELATRIPVSGGEFIFLKKLFHPLLGFLSGWTSFVVGFSVPIALSAMGFSEYFFSAIVQFLPADSVVNLVVLKKLTASSIIIIFTLIHYIGAGLGSKVQNILTLLKVFLILGLTYAGLMYGQGSWSNINYSSNGNLDGFAFGTAMMMVMFAYSGWNASAYITGELKNSKRAIPVSLISGTSIVIILYILINIFIFYSTPYTNLQGQIAIVEKACISAFGTWVTNILSGIIAVIMLSSLSAFLIIGPRVYTAMAENKMFFPFASRIHKKYGVPGKSILIQGITALVMVISGSFEQLLIYMGFALGIFPFIAVVGLFKARKQGIGEATAVKISGFPFIPGFFLLCSFIILIIAYINRPVESSIAIATVLLGIPCYYLFIRKNS